MKRLVVFIVVTLTFALFVSACGGDDQEATPAPETKQETVVELEPTAAPAQAPAATEAPEPTVAATEEESELSLDDRTSGLANLESYRLTWRSEWTKEGETQPGFIWEWEQEVVKDPPATHLTWRTQDATAAEDRSFYEIWTVGDTTYMRMGSDAEGAQCIALTQEDSQDDAAFDPTMLGGLSDAKYLGRETVNGIPTRKYVYDKLGLAIFGADDLTGMVWVADDGGYVVKEELSWKGGAGPFAALASTEDDKGAGKWTWELRDANQPITIEPPEDCGSAEEMGIPVMPDAEMQMQSPMGINYTTPAKVDAVKQFYQEEMPRAGWTAEGEPMDLGAEMAQLAYSREGKQAQIIITSNPDTGGSAVIIVVTE